MQPCTTERLGPQAYHHIAMLPTRGATAAYGTAHGRQHAQQHECIVASATMPNPGAGCHTRKLAAATLSVPMMQRAGRAGVGATCAALATGGAAAHRKVPGTTVLSAIAHGWLDPLTSPFAGTHGETPDRDAGSRCCTILEGFAVLGMHAISSALDTSMARDLLAYPAEASRQSDQVACAGTLCVS
jgi:hypothetical protein